MALKDEAPTQQGDEHEGEEHGHGGKKKPKMVMIIGAVVLVLILAGAGYFLLMKGDSKKDAEHEEAATEESAEGEHGEAAEGEHGEAGKEGEHGAKGADGKAVPGIVFYDLPDFVVNLSDKGSKTRFLKLSVTLELPDQETMQKVDQMRPRIMDSFQVYLRELRKSDLEGSAGLYRLREELLLRVNKTVYPAKVNDILFKELITQ